MTEIIRAVVSGQRLVVSAGARRGAAENDDLQIPKIEDQRPKTNPKSKIRNLKSQSGLSLIAVMAVLTLFAIGLLAIAPTVQQGIQRDKELETIRRGEEVADAIRQYVAFYGGAKLPNSMDDLLEGLPQGTKKRQILRPSAVIDPLSEDGKWRLIQPASKPFVNFGRRVQIYNNGMLPASPQQLQRFAIPLANILNTETDSDVKDAEEEIETMTDKAPFIGVASQSRGTSVIAYYGIENHSKWIFTPLFRSAGTNGAGNGGITNKGNGSDKPEPPPRRTIP